LANNIIISGTSCLIALDRIGHLEILHKLFFTIATTSEVQKEFEKPLPSWISLKPVENNEKIKELELMLDKGEASAISLALETPNSILIIDEKKGRSVAKNFNLEIIGTLGIILLAKQRGIIPSAKEVITMLADQNFRFSDSMLNTILKEANEI